MADSTLPGSPLTANIPNAAYPTAGLGLVLGTNGLMDPIALGTGTRTGTKFLRDDQTWQPSGSTTYRKNTSLAISSTVAATDLLHGEITIAAGVMGTTGAVRLKAWGNHVQNSGGVANVPRFQLVFGGVTLIDNGIGGTTQNLANRLGWEINAEIINLSSASSQDVTFNAVLSAAISANAAVSFVTGNGVSASYISGNFGHIFSQGENTSAVNTASAQALVLNVINGSASASCETKLTGALVEVIQ